MKCEICNKKKASAVVYRDGKELYVCKDCASQNDNTKRFTDEITDELDLPKNFKGKIHIHGEQPPPDVMDALLKATMKFVEGIANINPDAEKVKDDKKCPDCKTSWAQIENTSMLGCPTCYKTFADDIRKEMLSPMYGRRHVGKAPEGADIDKSIEALKRKLKAAVKKEQYEIASKLQKQIDELTLKSKGGK
jgi:protein-arginine kinase activator protein McsA